MVIFCMSLTWLSTWRGRDMSSASIATASTSRKSILACWPARGDKPVSLIDPLSQSRSLSLLVPIYEPLCCLHARGIYWRVSGRRRGRWDVGSSFFHSNTTGQAVSNGALTAHRQCSRMGIMTCMCRHPSADATHLMTCKHVMTCEHVEV